MQTCKCCGQHVKYQRGTWYGVDALYKDGAFLNDLPHMLGVVEFTDGAKVVCMLSRITEQLLAGQKEAGKTICRPIAFKY